MEDKISLTMSNVRSIFFYILHIWFWLILLWLSKMLEHISMLFGDIIKHHIAQMYRGINNSAHLNADFRVPKRLREGHWPWMWGSKWFSGGWDGLGELTSDGTSSLTGSRVTEFKLGFVSSTGRLGMTSVPLFLKNQIFLTAHLCR